MYDKGLLIQCAKELVAIKRLAYKYEDHLCLLEAIYWERRILYAKAKNDKQVDALFDEMNDVCRAFRDTQVCFRIMAEMSNKMNVEGFVRTASRLDDYKEALKKYDLQESMKKFEFTVNLRHQNLLVAIYQEAGDYANMEKVLKEEMIEVTKDLRDKRALIYFNFISWVQSKAENKSYRDMVKENALVKKI